MAKRNQHHSSLAFSLLLTIYANCILAFVSKNHTCGTLLSYRHYIVQLEAAPTCFVEGCTGEQKPTSMSSTCPEDRPCSQLWKTIHDQYQQNWCAGCKKDVACRISGWPTLNASALCDLTPNTWIFGPEGTCCTSGNQPFELAQWLGSMCNDSEWRPPFKYYDGSAKLDWEEWVMPWNWTARAENTSTFIVPEKRCNNKHLSLLTLAGENVLFLAFAVSAFVAQLRYIKARAKGDRSALVLHKAMKGVKFWKPIWRMIKGPRSPEDQGKRYDMELLILVSVLLCCLQVGSNFLNAWRMHSMVGYQNTPIVLLALLFCCRPRLTWLICGADLIPRQWLYDRFGTEDEVIKSEMYRKLTSIGLGTAIGEVVLQSISVYSLVRVANTGRTRSFYRARSLSPFWRGPAAIAMYSGALIWLIGCLLVILGWFYYYYLSAKATAYATRYWRKVKGVTNRVASKVPPLTYRFPGKRKPKPPHSDIEKLHRRDSEKVGRGIERKKRHRPGGLQLHAGEIVQKDPTRPVGGAGIDKIGPGVSQPSGARIERLQPQDQTRLSPGGHTNERVGPADADNRDSITPVAFGGRSRDSRSDALSGTTNFDEENNLLAFSGQKRASAGELYAEGDSDHEKEEQKQPEPQEPDPNELRNKKLKQQFTWVVLVIGLFSWIAQWVFWGGFVHAAGPRYCPPSLYSTAVLWLTASVSGLGIPFVVK